MRVHFVGIVLIVQELGRGPSGVNDQGIESGRRKRSVRPAHQSPQMLHIELIQTGFAHFDSLFGIRRPKVRAGRCDRQGVAAP